MSRADRRLARQRLDAVIGPRTRAGTFVPRRSALLVPERLGTRPGPDDVEPHPPPARSLEELPRQLVTRRLRADVEAHAPAASGQARAPVADDEAETPVASGEARAPVADDEAETPVVPGEARAPVADDEAETPMVSGESRPPVAHGCAAPERAAVGGGRATLPVAGGWVPSAMRIASQGYRQAYGTATDLTTDEVPRVRVRLAVPWRLAASAATVVALVVGATLIRASALAPGDPIELPVPAVSAGVDGRATGAGSAGAGADRRGAAPTASGGYVVVHVIGAVLAPGVVRLPTGARVEEAVAAAGGARPEADVAALNLARVLTDGEQLVVPGPGDAVQPAPTGAAAGAARRLDLNAATLADLDALPGVGPVLAQRILARRQQHRFTSVDELGEVSGIGPTLLERLRPLVQV